MNRKITYKTRLGRQHLTFPQEWEPDDTYIIPSNNNQKNDCQCKIYNQ